MSCAPVDDLRILLLVARERSFTRAAATLGIPQSTGSRAIKSLEERLDTRLLDRTTRSVSLTEAGQQLVKGIEPELETIDHEIAHLTDRLGRVEGPLKITTVRHAFETVLRPVLQNFLSEYPRVALEVVIDDAFADIVANRFDAGIRFGGLVEKDMVALRVGRDVKAAVVASPSYVNTAGAPGVPNDLLEHRCINYRTAKAGSLYRWRFNKAEKVTEVRVQGNLILNDGDAILSAAVDGHGIAFTFEDRVRDLVSTGQLVSLLADWCPTFPGCHIYYSSRRHVSPALKALTKSLINNNR